MFAEFERRWRLNSGVALLTVQPSLTPASGHSLRIQAMTTLAAALPATSVLVQLPLLLPITLSTTVLSAMFQLVLTALVIRRRTRMGISLLDGGDVLLTQRIRAHANFTETVPIALLLMLLLELARCNAALLAGCAVLLIGGRLLHAVGILRPTTGLARQVGMVCTLTSVLLMALGGAWLLSGRL
jgi:uncharacterized protein